MRRGLAGDVHAAALGCADEGDAFLRGDVADMVGAAGLLGELAAVRGDDVYIRSIELVPAGEAVSEDKKKSSRNERNEKARQTLVVVNVSLYGSAQEREASFAEFINRLEGLNRGGTMTVVTEDSVDNGVAYAIRMSGGF